jgi:branched-chain amino acid transport system ATP-binding protein
VTALLELEGLVAGHAGLPVVQGLDLHVDEGEIVALFGANGAGKTTTLLTVSGLLAPIRGEVIFDGRRLNGQSANSIARTGVGHVTEDRALFYALTTKENLQLGRRAGGYDIAQVLDWLPPLEPLLDRRAGLLSGGEQQMLALARALVGRPRLLMVDEMSLGLAPVIVDRLLELLRDIARREKLSVLLVEQHVHLALDLAERAYVLSHGTLTYTGDCRSLKERPDLLEASYLGEPVPRRSGAR